jgi:hypothetical protein
MIDDSDDDGINFATAEYVEVNETLAYDIVEQVFGMEAAFISDLSSLDNFLVSPERDAAAKRKPSERDIRSLEDAYRRIQSHYGVDVRPEVLIWRIAERIERSRK